MAETGAVVTPQTIPNQKLLPPGQRGSYPIFFLRSTPPIFNAQRPGATNQSWVQSAYVPTKAPIFFTGSRRVAAAPTVGTLKTGQVTFGLTAGIATAGAKSTTGSVAVPLSFSFSVGVNLVTGSVTMPLTFTIGAQNSAALTLTAEASDLLTLDPEVDDDGGLVLVAESSDSLTLEPES